MECEAAALTNDRGVVVAGVLVDHRFRTTCFGREACCALEGRVVGVVLPNWKIRGYFQEDVGLGPDKVHTIALQARVFNRLTGDLAFAGLCKALVEVRLNHSKFYGAPEGESSRLHKTIARFRPSGRIKTTVGTTIRKTTVGTMIRKDYTRHHASRAMMETVPRTPRRGGRRLTQPCYQRRPPQGCGGKRTGDTKTRKGEINTQPQGPLQRTTPTFFFF